MTKKEAKVFNKVCKLLNVYAYENIEIDSVTTTNGNDYIINITHGNRQHGVLVLQIMPRVVVCISS